MSLCVVIELDDLSCMSKLNDVACMSRKKDRDYKRRRANSVVLGTPIPAALLPPDPIELGDSTTDRRKICWASYIVRP